MRSASGSGKMLGIPFPNFLNKSASSTDVRIRKEGFDSIGDSKPPAGFSPGAKLNKNASKSAEKYLPKCENSDNGYDLLKRPSSSHERPSS